jgi:IPT/TIG domain
MIGAAGSELDQAGHPGSQLIAILAIIALMVVVAAIASFKGLVMGADKRLSTSKTTALIWTAFVVYAFLTQIIIALQVHGTALTMLQDRWKAIPSDNYLLLLGGPFAALVGAKGLVVSRLANGRVQKVDGDNVVRPSDLISDDTGHTDVVDLQFVLFNLVALFLAVATFAQHPMQGLPPIPDGLAALTSVSALAYLGSKAVDQSTPKISLLNPATVRAGGLVTVTGLNLLPPHNPGTVEADVAPIVTVGGVGAVVLPGATAGSLQFIVPPGLSAGSSQQVIVTSQGQSTASDQATLTVEADQVTLTRLVPNPANPGDRLTLLGHNLLDPGPGPANPPVVTVGGQPAGVDLTASTNDQLLVDTTGLPIAGVQADVVVSRPSLPPSAPVQLQWKPVLTGAVLTAGGQGIMLTVTGTALPPAGVGTVSLALPGQPPQAEATARSGDDIQVSFSGSMPPPGTVFLVTVVDQLGQATRFQGNV